MLEVIVTVFHIFKKLQSRLYMLCGNIKDTKKKQIEPTDIKTVISKMKHTPKVNGRSDTTEEE